MTARRRNRRRRRGRASFPLRLLCLVVVLAALIGAATMFFRVERVVTDGNVRYTDEELVAASGVQQGDNLALLNKYEIKKAIFEQLPYVETVSISRSYPDVLVLSVTESAAACAIPDGDGVWLMSSGGKLLEYTAQADEALVTGCALESPTVGSEAAFTEEDSYKRSYLLALLRAAEEQQLISQLGAIDLTDGGHISFTYAARFTVKLPWDADMERSLRAVQKIVSEKLESNETGTIDLMNLAGEGRAYFIPDE